MEKKSDQLFKPIVINVAIYRLHVVVVVGWPLHKIMGFGVRRGIKPEDFTPNWKSFIQQCIEDEVNGFCSDFGHKNSDILIWLRVRPTTATEYGVLWHEISHAVDKIAKQADQFSGFFDNSGSSEPRAYLFEYIAVQASKVLWNL